MLIRLSCETILHSTHKDNCRSIIAHSVVSLQQSFPIIFHPVQIFVSSMYFTIPISSFVSSFPPSLSIIFVLHVTNNFNFSLTDFCWSGIYWFFSAHIFTLSHSPCSRFPQSSQFFDAKTPISTNLWFRTCSCKDCNRLDN